MKLCKHFSECGGCQFQDRPYKQQLDLKIEKVKDLAVSWEVGARIKPVVYKEEWFYRNKMEFSFADQKGLVCGLYSKKEKRKVVNIEECLIFSKDTQDILETIREFCREKKYSVYNKYSHKGFLRNLIIRQAKFTKQTMIGLVTGNSQVLDKKEFVKRLLSLKLEMPIKSIYQIINDSFSDAVIFEKKELLYGSSFIEEKLGSYIFRIGIDTFFQVNPRMAVDFYGQIKKYLNLSGKENVLDLFCGVGSIGIFLASGGSQVWGVELSEEIVEKARENAKINNVENISFFACDVRKFLNIQGAPSKDIDVLVINPPRGGLSNKIIRAILRLKPKVIIYSSCNPDSLFRDLKGLTISYSVDFVEPYDFFPHTKHFECLSFLRRS